MGRVVVGAMECDTAIEAGGRGYVCLTGGEGGADVVIRAIY